MVARKSQVPKLKLTGSLGAAFVEFLVAIPVFLVPLAGLVDFGLYFNNAHTFENLARDSARFATTIAAADFPVSGSSSSAPAAVAIRSSVINPWLTDHPNIDAASISVSVLPIIDPNTTTRTADDGTSCDRIVSVTLRGQYRYSFLSLIGFREKELSRTVSMRWTAGQKLCS